MVKEKVVQMIGYQQVLEDVTPELEKKAFEEIENNK